MTTSLPFGALLGSDFCYGGINVGIDLFFGDSSSLESLLAPGRSTHRVPAAMASPWSVRSPATGLIRSSPSTSVIRSMVSSPIPSSLRNAAGIVTCPPRKERTILVICVVWLTKHLQARRKAHGQTRKITFLHIYGVQQANSTAADDHGSSSSFTPSRCSKRVKGLFPAGQRIDVGDQRRGPHAAVASSRSAVRQAEGTEALLPVTRSSFMQT